MDMIFLFGILFLCITLSIPIGFSIAIATGLTFYFYSDLPITVMAQASVTGIDSFPMMAIPFFILSGIIMSEGGVAKRLIYVAQAFVGHFTGGMGIVMTIACMFFGSISGSAPATVSAIGGFMIPEMNKIGYDKGFSASLAATAGTIGLIIPPSIAFVIYGVVTNTSIGDLFIAGIVPGVLMTIALSFACWIIAKKNNYPRTERIPRRKILPIIWDAKWAILTPVIILGGIYSGMFTPTEAAVIAVVYSVIIGLLVYKELTLKKLYNALVETMVLNGIILFMLGLANAFARYLNLAQAPAKAVNLITSLTDNPILLLLMLNVLLLLVGCIIDNVPVIIILAPIMLPVAMSAGLTPLQFGIVMVLNTTIGLVTPPYGPNLFIAASIANIKMEQMLRTLWILLMALAFVLIVVTYFPAVTTIFL